MAVVQPADLEYLTTSDTQDHSMKGSKDNITIRSLVAVVVVLGLTILILHFTNRFYNDPICQRYADSRQLTFVKSTMGWVKKIGPLNASSAISRKTSNGSKWPPSR